MSVHKLAKEGASAIIIYEGHILLFHRDNIPTIPFPDHWGLPGGGIEEGETPHEAVIRELKEEVSYAPRALHLIGKKIYGPDHITYLFISLIEKDEKEFFIHTGDEGQEIGFFAIKDALQLKLAPGILRYIKEYEHVLKKVIEKRYIPKHSDLDLLPGD